jgi:XTP/dITP diphosphohydrolase
MARRLAPGRLVVASHNRGKVVEIAELVEPFGVTPVSAGDLGLPEPEETGTTFAANAELKARAAAEATGLPALADDSGLSVASLDGRPGIHSARWAGEPRDFGRAMEKVEEALRAAGALSPERRRAWFTCALSLAWPDGEIVTVEGEVHGTLVWPPRGANGFGYDPVFVADGHDITFGEMAPEAKHAISHRARAFALLKAACLDGGD